MTKFQRWIVLLFFVAAASCVTGQNCNEYLKRFSCFPPEYTGYNKYSASRTALVDLRKTYKCAVSLTPGIDYIINLCCEPKYSPVRLRLIDEKNNSVFYDNSTEEYKPSITFTVSDHPINMIIEITVVGTKLKTRDLEAELKSCIMLWIYLKRLPE